MPLKAHLPLQETSGSTANDVCGSNDGTLNGGVTQGATGILGTPCYDFDGTDDCVNLGDVSSFSDNDLFSYTAWVYVNSFTSSGAGSVIGNEGRRRNLGVEADGQIALYGYDGSSTNFSTTDSISAGEWTFLSATFDGSTGRIYINGAEKANASFGYTEGSYDDWINFPANFGSMHPLDARMADVRVYDHALTPAEVQYLYEVPFVGSLRTGGKVL